MKAGTNYEYTTTLNENPVRHYLITLILYRDETRPGTAIRGYHIHILSARRNETLIKLY